MTERQRTIWAIAATAATVLGGFMVGRACSLPPARVETATRTDMAAAVVASSDSTRAVERRTERTDARPDGRKVTTVIVERVAEGAHVDTTATVETRTVTKTVVVRERASWRAGASAGWDLRELRPRPSLVQVDLARRVVGPFWLGAWARTDRTAGLSLAVEW